MANRRSQDPPAAARRVVYMPLGQITPAPRNPKEHHGSAIRASIERFGLADLPVLDERTGRLVSGHGRLEQAQAMYAAGQDPPDGLDIDPTTGEWRLPVIRGWASRSDIEADAYLVTANHTTTLGGWDDAALGQLLAELNDSDPALFEATGFTDDDLAALLTDDGAVGQGDGRTGNPSLADRFLIPPFDVLDTRQGYWQDRKRMWLRLGFTSGAGRGTHLARKTVHMADPRFYDKKTQTEAQLGRTLTTAQFEAEYYKPITDQAIGSGTSVFDPVLCEVAYRWFCPPGGHVFDPFAGGSVRGVVAAVLGRRYHGVDLRPEQVAANVDQAAAVIGQQPPADSALPVWTCGDAAAVLPGIPESSTDLVFTCPPYYSLERYSDDPADLSTMGYTAFDAVYGDIITGCARVLRQDRFAVFVTGDARDRHGHLHDLRGATVRAAVAAGLALYAGAVLLTQPGSAAIVGAARGFESTRTLARVHQDVLVFVKGDRKRAAAACGPVEVHIPEALADADPGDGAE